MVRRAQESAWAARAMVLGCLACCGCGGRPPGNLAPDALPSAPAAQAQAQAKPDAVRPVDRRCWLIGLDPGKVEDFLELQKKIPAPVREAIHLFGIRNYTVYVCRTKEQFYAIRYYEYVGDEYEGDMAALARDPDFKTWRNACEECEVPLLRPGTGEWWSEGQEALHLD